MDPYPEIDLTELTQLLASGSGLENPRNAACSVEMYAPNTHSPKTFTAKVTAVVKTVCSNKKL